MTTKADFSPQEWDLVLEGPSMAGMIVITASSGGTFKETWAMSKAYLEARKQHGESELLDEIVASKPKTDHTRVHSPQELREHGLALLRDVVALVAAKAGAEEVDGYRRFVLFVAQKVAEAHREDGQAVSPAEADAISQISAALGSDNA
jgi:hypothetical protein